MGLARRAQGARRRRCRCTSSTTSNAEIARNRHAPFGFRAARGQLRRWRSTTRTSDIASVAPPCICPRQERRRRDGARNAAPPNSRTGSKNQADLTSPSEMAETFLLQPDTKMWGDRQVAR